MDKQSLYKKLVENRQAHQFDGGLSNPSNNGFILNEIEPWAQWHNDLGAEILLIGQEFCDVDTFIKCEGLVERKKGVYEYPSNRNLAELFKVLDIEIGHPLAPNKSAKLFFTNAVMGLKPGSMSSNFKDIWLKESREKFLKPLIDIIQPRIIIPIGSKATKSLSSIFGFPFKSMKYHVENPLPTLNGVKVFPVFHTGGLGIRNRSFSLQIEDWIKIKNWMTENRQ